MRHEISYSGTVQDTQGRPIACPKCSQTRGHTICGSDGGTGSLKCRRGHRFHFPSDVNARERLNQAIHDVRRVQRRGHV